MHLSSGGYVKIGREYEHRLVWSSAHGAIPPGCHVHHINGDRTDNRIENLELVDAAEHGREHAVRGHRVRWGYSPAAPCRACGGSRFRVRRDSGVRTCIDCANRRQSLKNAERFRCPLCGGMHRRNGRARHLRRRHPEAVGTLVAWEPEHALAGER